MNCLANTGLDAIPLVILALVIVSAGVLLALRARTSKARWTALIAIPLVLGLGIATQSSATPAQAASASSSSSSSASAECPMPATSPATAPPGTVVPTSSPTPTPTPTICQAVNDKSLTGDIDSDGVVDACDLDSDNDGIPDLAEDTNQNGRFTDDDYEGDFAFVNTLGDGQSNYRDLDSDNDSILDLSESGIALSVINQLDTDGNGILDAGTAVGTNGLADALETSPDSGILNYTVRDVDSDGNVPDFLDVASNNIAYDLYLVGNGAFDPLGGGNITPIVDVDLDGIMDQVDTDTSKRGAPGSPISPYAS